MPVVVDLVYLVRHGETDWSNARRHTGRTDIPLNDAGERRAAGVSTVLAGQPGVDTATVLVSPLRRAVQTCELAGFGDRAETVADLVEWDYGEYEGTRTLDIRKTRPNWSIWTDNPKRGETLAEVSVRVDRVIARLRQLDGAAVLFSHAHLLRILAARWCGFAPEAGSRLTLLPASLSVLAHEREVPTIAHWNAGSIPVEGPEHEPSAERSPGEGGEQGYA